MDSLASEILRILAVASVQLLLMALLAGLILRAGGAGNRATRAVLGLAVLVPFFSAALLLRSAPARPHIAVPVSGSWLPGPVPPPPAGPDQPAIARVSTPPTPAPDPGPAGVEVPGGPSVAAAELPSVKVVLALLWAAGALLLSVRAAFAYRRVLSAVRRATPVRSDRLSVWAASQGLAAAPRLRSLPERTVPFVAGALRPVIVIPDRLLEPGEEDRLEFAVRHELAHVRARDGLWVLPELLLRIILFVHPVVPMLLRWFRVEREHAADLAVAEATGRRGAYAEFLLREQRESMAVRGALPATALWHRSSETARRIRRLAEKRRPTMTRKVLSRIAPALAVAALVLIVLLRPVAVGAEKEDPTGREKIARLVREYRPGTSPANRDLSTRLLAIGEEAIPEILAAARDEDFPGRGNAAVVLARLLRALGRTSDEAKEILGNLAKSSDRHHRECARWGRAVLAQKVPLEEGAEQGKPLSPETVVRALRDGNEHVRANNVLVDMLLLHGTQAIEPLIRALADETFTGRGYAAWSLAVVMFGTEGSTDEGWAALRAAARDPSAYVHTLARSGFSLFVVPGSPQPVRGSLGSAAPEAPAAGASLALLERTVARGLEAVPSLVRTIRDGSFPERRRAAVLLGRILRVGGEHPEAAVAALREAARSEDSGLKEAAEEALRTLSRETPLGDAGRGALEFTPRRIVRALRDGNEHRLADNILVDMLLLHGEAAIVPLVESAADETFAGRGYAAWALGCVLRATGRKSPEAVAVLKAASRSRSPYVRALSRSALTCLGRED